VVFSPAPGFWQSDFSPDQSHHRPSCTTKTAAVRFGPPALQPRGQRHCHGRPTAPCPKHSAPIIAMKAPPRRLVALSPATLPPSIHHGITSIGRAGGGKFELIDPIMHRRCSAFVGAALSGAAVCLHHHCRPQVPCEATFDVRGGAEQRWGWWRLGCTAAFLNFTPARSRDSRRMPAPHQVYAPTHPR